MVPKCQNPKGLSDYRHIARCTVNDKKSYLYFSGGTDLLKHETHQQIGCQEGELPVKYLGIPLSSTRNYLWRGKNEGSKEIVAWKDICLSKSEDSLGIKALESRNKAVLGKQLWKVLTSKTSLWVVWVKKTKLCKLNF
ncbi:hypothetical protein GOBAR_DD07610 [Gossypium barbadense]|nr:hypothetical protein GOBAR_DD07610 [Gossypium barbadense]